MKGFPQMIVEDIQSSTMRTDRHMTRDEAIRKINDKSPGGPEGAKWLVDALIALNLLKVDEPLTSDPVAWAKALAYPHVKTGNDLITMFSAFEAAGLVIVRKEDVK